MDYDAILVPGGGLTASGEPSQWVIDRLDAAITRTSQTTKILCLSRGTVHKPPPLNTQGFPYSEGRQSAAYLLSRGVSKQQIWIEDSSLDTVGNAFFSRSCHLEMTPFRRLLIITSEFHIDRTRAIFEWVFHLAPARGYRLAFEAVPDTGLSSAEIAARVAKEQTSLASLSDVFSRVQTMGQLHEFMFTEHGAYTAGTTIEPGLHGNTAAITSY